MDGRRLTLTLSSPLWPLKVSKMTIAGGLVANSRRDSVVLTNGIMTLLINEPLLPSGWVCAIYQIQVGKGS